MPVTKSNSSHNVCPMLRNRKNQGIGVEVQPIVPKEPLRSPRLPGDEPPPPPNNGSNDLAAKCGTSSPHAACMCACAGAGRLYSCTACVHANARAL